MSGSRAARPSVQSAAALLRPTPWRALSRWQRVGRVVVMVVLLALALAGLVAYLRHVQRQDITSQVWRLVDTRYYDRSFNGYDWPAVRLSALRRIPTKDDATHSGRDAAIQWMLAKLESSHASFVPAWAAQPAQAGKTGMDSFTELIGSTVGLTLVQNSVAATPTVVSVDAGSRLRALGAQPGLHLVPAIAMTPGSSASAPGYVVTARDGETLPFMLAAPAAETSPPATLDTTASRILVPRLDAAALQALSDWQRQGLDPRTEVRFEADGLTTTLGDAGGAITVVDVAIGSEAERAGIEPGAVVTQLQFTQGQKEFHLTVSAGLLGQPRVTLRAVGAPITDFNVDRRSARLIGGALVLRFDAFDAGTLDWVVQQIQAQPFDRLVLDLRHNHGGEAEQMKTLLGHLLPGGTVIGMTRSATEIKPVTVAALQGQPLRQPAAVLIGPLTNSAAEVTAAALQSTHRAIVVGKRSAGNVVFAQTLPLADGGMLQVPVADYIDAQGRRLERLGVVPDRDVWNTLADVRADRDRPLDEALAALRQ